MMMGKRRRLAATLAGATVMSVALLGGASPAAAAIGVVVVPDVQLSVTVGTTVPAQLTLSWSNTGAESTYPNRLDSMALVPSCGENVSGGSCGARNEDPGVLVPSATATGLGGACPGTTFSLAPDTTPTGIAQGRYLLTWPGTITLTPAGLTHDCPIAFNLRVARSPAKDAAGAEPGLQTSPKAAVGFRADNGGAGLPGISQGTTSATVLRGAIAMRTQAAPAAIVVGSAFADTATLTAPAGGPAPTGTVRFDVYDNPTCTGTPTLTSTNPVAASGTTALSNDFTPPAPATYRVVATYSGDANWLELAGACNDPAESVVVTRATPAITTQAATGVQLGRGTLSDSAAVTGLVHPVAGATVTFRLYGPSDSACTGTPVFTSPVAVALAGSTATASSAPFTPTTSGVYRWIATYDGDANNQPVSGSCGLASESATVLPGIAPLLAPAKLEVVRARVVTATRRLDVVAPISWLASGKVAVSFRSAGHTARFTTKVDAARRRVRIRRRIAPGQARLATGILTLTYPGDADTQPQKVRLRAASVPAALKAARPTIAGGRLKARGRISRRARGVVRLQLVFQPAGQSPRTLEYSARISNGRYSLSRKLPAGVLAQIAARRGVVHSYTLFTGYRPADMRGEMASFRVLAAR